MSNVTNLDLRAQRSRLALIEAGIELFIQNPNASLSDVATFAGVGRATLYRHFESRDDLIRTIAQDSLEKTDEVLLPLRQKKLKARELIEEGLKVIVPLAKHYHFLLSLWNIAAEDKKVMAIYKRQLKDLSALIDEAKKQKAINKNLSTDWIVSMYDCVLYTSWYMVGQGMSEQDVIDHAITSFFSGVEAN